MRSAGSLNGRSIASLQGAYGAINPPAGKPVSVGVGAVNEAFGKCQGPAGADTARACSVVLNAPGAANPWKEVARARRDALLPGSATPGRR